MAEIVPQHTHCLMCAKSIKLGETLCSEQCKQKYNSMVRKRKLIVYLMYGMLVAIILIFVVYNRM